MVVVVMNAWSILVKGGAMMVPIIALSILSIAIGINRISRLSSIEKKLKVQRNILLGSLQQGDLKSTLNLCEQHEGILGPVMKAGILRFGSSRDLIKGSMQEALHYQQGQLKQFMGLLSLIINVAPLLGLLGTVNAMAVVFHAVQIRSNVLNPLTAGELATGIWQALLTTSAGLVVSILSFAVYSFCAERINAIVAQLEYAVTQITNVLQQLSELKQSQVD